MEVFMEDFSNRLPFQKNYKYPNNQHHIPKYTNNQGKPMFGNPNNVTNVNSTYQQSDKHNTPHSTTQHSTLISKVSSPAKTNLHTFPQSTSSMSSSASLPSLAFHILHRHSPTHQDMWIPSQFPPHHITSLPAPLSFLYSLHVFCM